MVDKMREARVRWFEHMNRRNIDSSTRSCERLVESGLGRGRRRKNSELIRQHMSRDTSSAR